MAAPASLMDPFAIESAFLTAVEWFVGIVVGFGAIVVILAAINAFRD